MTTHSPLPRRRTARVAGPRRDRRRLALGAVLVTGALFVGTSVAAVTMGRGSGTSADCARISRLEVAVAPEAELVVTGAAGRLRTADPCVSVRTVAAGGDSVRSRLGDAGGPDVWVPDSSSWLAGLPAEQIAQWQVRSTAIARSPILLAMPTSGKYAAEPDPPSWPALINTSGAVQMVDLEHEASGRLVFDAARAAGPEALTTDVAARLIFMSRYAAASTADLLDQAARGGDVAPFPVPEFALAQWARFHPGMVRAVVPAAGTPALDYPVLVRTGLPPIKQSVVDRLVGEMVGSQAQATLKAVGLRTTDHAHGPTIDALSAPDFTEIALRTPAQQLTAVEQWEVLRKDMRMLAVVDVSGSMAWPAVGGNGVTRAQVTEDACVTALGILPAGSKIGGWMFSTGLDGPTVPWRPMAPVAPLDATEGTSTHRQNLIDMVHTMKSRLQGDTALYDTSLAALKHMTDTYEPQYVNSVVLLTDGVNDNPLGGLTLDELLVEIKRTYDPKRPVRIITIGMGEADSSALQAISAATGGTSYIANTAEDIKRVFVEALLARRADVINPAS